MSSVRPSREHPVGHHGDRDLEVDGGVDATLADDALEGFGLHDGAGEPVEQDTVLLDVGLGQALGDDAVHDLVGHESAGVHDGLGLLAQLGAVGHRGAQHVARRHVQRAVVIDQAQGLSALTRTLPTEDDQMQRAAAHFKNPS